MNAEEWVNDTEPKREESPSPLRDPLLREKREEILKIAAKHGATNVRVFGSRARGEARPDSDVDLLVDAGPRTTPWFPGGLMADLEDLLGVKVEVGMVVHEYVRERVMREAVAL